MVMVLACVSIMVVVGAMVYDRSSKGVQTTGGLRNQQVASSRASGAAYNIVGELRAPIPRFPFDRVRDLPAVSSPDAGTTCLLADLTSGSAGTALTCTRIIIERPWQSTSEVSSFQGLEWMYDPSSTSGSGQRRDLASTNIDATLTNPTTGESLSLRSGRYSSVIIHAEQVGSSPKMYVLEAEGFLGFSDSENLLRASVEVEISLPLPPGRDCGPSGYCT